MAPHSTSKFGLAKAARSTSASSSTSNSTHVPLLQLHNSLSSRQQSTTVVDVDFAPSFASSASFYTSPETLVINPDRTQQAIALILAAHLRAVNSVPIRFDKSARNAHFWVLTFRSVFSLFATIFVLITFVEEAPYCKWQKQCNNYMSTIPPRLPILSPTVTISIEFTCLIVLFIECYLYLFAQGVNNFFKRKLHLGMVLVLSFYALDLAFLLLMMQLQQPWIRIGPYLRLIILGMRSRQIRRQIWLIIQILPTFCLVLVMIGLTIILFAFVGVAFFPGVLDSADNQIGAKFVQYLELLWLVFVGATPETVESLRNMNFAYFLFFFLFGIMTVLFMQNLLFAIVFTGYQIESQEDIEEETHLIKMIMREAWDCVDIEKRGYLRKGEFEYLLDSMTSHLVFRRLLNRETYNIVFWISDSDRNGVISFSEFLQLTAILNFQFDVYYKKTFIQKWFPKFAQFNVFQQLCKFIQPKQVRSLRKSNSFEITVMIALSVITLLSVVNIIVVITQRKISTFTLSLDILICVFFSTESVLRMLTMGWHKFWSEYKFEFFVTLSYYLPSIVVIGQQLDLFNPVNLIELSEQQPIAIGHFIVYFFALQVPAILRFFRQLVLFVPFIKVVFMTSSIMIRTSYKLLYVLFCSIYFLSVLGVQLFGQIALPQQQINLPRLNDIPSALMLFSNVVYSNQITSTALSYMIFTGSGLVWIFFIAADLIIVYICINLFISFTIQTFMMEWSRRTQVYAETSSLIFMDSDVFLSGNLVSTQINTEIETVKATMQGYTSAQIDRIKVAHDIFERKAQLQSIVEN